MKLLFQFIVALNLLIIPSILPALQWTKTYSTDPYIGPEIYYMERTKEGGAKQTGTLYGVRLGYDHVQRYKFYWGIDFLWATGTLNGEVKKKPLNSAGFDISEGLSQKTHLKSEFTDMNVEARLGYTFQSKGWRCASFTPYVGLGYFWENNNYKHPSPLEIHFKNRFSYAPVGFLSQIFITPQWSLGLNFKVRILLEAKQKVTNDPEFDTLTQHYTEKLQYRGELPISYYFCLCNYPLAISLVPFAEYRAYGHKANFPFDFLETQLHLYGATLKMQYLF